MNCKTTIFVAALIGLASSLLSAQVSVGKRNSLPISTACSAKLAGPKPALDWPTMKTKSGHLISDCVPMNLKSTYAPQPIYPEVARVVRASGLVSVEVVIGKNGRVIWADVAEGHPLLRAVALEAACKTRFKPVKDCFGRKLRTATVLYYNFKP